LDSQDFTEIRVYHKRREGRALLPTKNREELQRRGEEKLLTEGEMERGEVAGDDGRRWWPPERSPDYRKEQRRGAWRQRACGWEKK
jgi:hypothetical protein